jgi:hypothetical protein
MADETPAAIELRACLYPAQCTVRTCRSKATVIARAVDAGGRPIRQYDLWRPNDEAKTLKTKVALELTSTCQRVFRAGSRPTTP